MKCEGMGPEEGASKPPPTREKIDDISRIVHCLNDSRK